MTKANACIIDCDPGIDDTLAILHAMGSPKVDLKAITLCFGNTNRANVTRNLFTILHVLGKEVSAERIASLPAGPNRDRLEHIRTKRPVVSVGAEAPLSALAKNGEYFHGADGLGGLHLNDPDLAPSDWAEILGLLDPERQHGKEAEPNTITVIGIGPLTNLAMAYEKDPVTFSRCKRVICMGGALGVPGNATPVAEFNFYACPDSVHTMLQATAHKDPAKSIKLYMLPTNVTKQVPLESTVLEQYVKPLETPLSRFAIELFRHLFDLLLAEFHHTSMSLHDPLCIGFFIDLEDETISDVAQVGWQVEEQDVRIETQGLLTRGMLVVDRRLKSQNPASGSMSRTRVVLKADPARYLASMLHDVWGVTNYKTGSQ
ncbi:hypothetical protein BGZ65_004500 [Modicella reniformis]|uniref:Inosine/uridine-preferring nucleoside hydrolase domain-containing protein n=1 Tax=Modicella reniformis TaxID=1440133 RepID=A0A9P6IKJ1_9FUNG|nr:hypothetical protein BGZ65_004500 [Modicella reniformis]